jgi:hypothetical protein
VSRGPGRIERAIRALFDGDPDWAFTTDDMAAYCYGLNPPQVERKHRVAVVRAATKVLSRDTNWRCVWATSQGRLIYYNAASARSVTLGNALRFGLKVLSVAERADNTLLALAAQARALATENDPDAIRAGLAEIAAALEQLARPPVEAA